MRKVKKLNVIVIGAGMAGILAAIKLREAGDHVIVLEKADRIGGTWRDNRYLGLTCDVPAHAYTYSFAPNPEWSRYYAPGAEIQEYFESVVDKYGIRDTIQFGVEVAQASWVDGGWTLETKDGKTYRADAVIAATGVLHHPRMPEIDGLAGFEGQAFHSAQWRDGIELEGKKVSVIGSGSTGVQLVSALAGVAAQVNHFQRSPQWIMPVEDFAYTDEQREIFRNDPAAVDAIRFDEEYISNVRRFNDAIVDPESEAMGIIEGFCLQNLEASIEDPVLREKLRPDYRAACKRLIYSPNYYQKVQLPGVEIVRDKIACVEPTGIRTQDGRLYESDVIIFATGFHTDRFVRPINIIGRHNVSLNDVWAVRPSAFLAISVPDFPNLFMLNGPTAPVGNFSLIDIAEAQWGYVDQLLVLIRQGDADAVSAHSAAMADYDKRRIAAAKKTIFASGCQSWYLDAQGVPSTWPWAYDKFFEAMEKPDLSAYDIRQEAGA